MKEYVTLIGLAILVVPILLTGFLTLFAEKHQINKIKETREKEKSIARCA